MAKLKITKSSPQGTPIDEILYIFESTTTSRVKFRKQDIEKELAQLDDQISKKQARKSEVQDILNEINKL